MACFTKGTPKFVTSAQSRQWTNCQFHLQTNFQQVKYVKEYLKNIEEARLMATEFSAVFFSS